MNLADLIIIILLVMLVSLLIYFSFIKNRENPCHNCPYSKRCNKNKCSSNKENNN